MVMAKNGKTPEQKEAFNGLLFSNATSIARELVPAFINFLGGSTNSIPAIDLTYPVSGDDKPVGSRNLWERIVFGGYLTNRMTLHHPLDDRQAGTFWIVDKASGAKQLDPAGIARFVERSMSDRRLDSLASSTGHLLTALLT